MHDELLQMTIRLKSPIHAVLARKAAEAGQETADYAADIIAKVLLDAIRVDYSDCADRIQAELEIKAAAVQIARAIVAAAAPGDDLSDVTLRTFRTVRTNAALDDKYRRAIGGGDPTSRGHVAKANLNRTLGSAIKVAVGGTVRTKNGVPDKVQLARAEREYIFSYTPLIVPAAAA